MSQISYFRRIRETTKPEAETSILTFLKNVKEGMWRDKIEPINALKHKDPKELKNLVRDAKAKTLPYVTISGTFSKFGDANLIKHSGFICLDIDGLENIEEEWGKIIKDEHTYGAFKSASGKGIAVVVKINPKKHKESYKSLISYYLENFQIILDKSCSNVSRARFVSYDPNTFTNEESQVFNKLIKVEKKKTSKDDYNFNNIVIGDNDIDHIVQQLRDRSIDICQTYEDWRNVGFALASEFGERGREYFHAISSIGSEYSTEKADDQYTKCVKSDGGGVTIATIFHHAKENNVSIQTKQTRDIARLVSIRKGGRDATLENVKNLVKETLELDDKSTMEVVEKAFKSDNDIKKDKDLSNDEKLLIYLKSNHKIRKNVITGKFEDDGVEMKETNFNTIAVDANRFFKASFRTDSVMRVVDTTYTEHFNPIKDFFEKNRHIKPVGEVQKLCDALIAPPNAPDNFEEYKNFFVRKWLVGLIQTVYEKHSPLVLVLLGPQNCGKTHFFRHFLPKKLGRYVAEKEPGPDKDFDLLLCQKWLISNDEWSGGTRKEEAKFKALCSRQTFDLRKPYGRGNETFRRLSVLCGTTNDRNILNDPTGNRRIIPIEIVDVNKDIYNSMDREKLILEVFHMYNEGGWNTELTRENIEMLNKTDEEYTEETVLGGLINRYFKTPEEMEVGLAAKQMNSTDIREHIAGLTSGNFNYSLKNVGVEMRALGHERKSIRRDGRIIKAYELQERAGVHPTSAIYIPEGDGNIEEW